MDTIHTLSALLQQSNCQYQVFDLGRRIRRINNDNFSQIEQGQLPYPFPMQRKAHLAIAYWNELKQPWIWFLCFELDERGLFKQSDIGNFIRYVLEAMGTHLGKSMSEEQQQKLANNPYTYKPQEDKMAVFHSQLRSHLDFPASRYYEHAQVYFSGELGWNNWQTVGLQGISDICTRLAQENNDLLLAKALPHLPAQPLYALLGVLEHIELPKRITSVLVQLTQQQLDSQETDLFLLAALLRALAGAPSEIAGPLLSRVLANPLLSHQEVLVAIAGRSWHLLQDADNAELFLLRLAQTGNQQLFNQLFADLVMLPELRMIFLPMLNSNPSAELAQALLQLRRDTRSKG